MQCFAGYIKVSLLDVSEMFVLGVSSMYEVIMHYLNSFLSCSIRNLNSASLSFYSQ